MKFTYGELLDCRLSEKTEEKEKEIGRWNAREKENDKEKVR